MATQVQGNFLDGLKQLAKVPVEDMALSERSIADCCSRLPAHPVNSRWDALTGTAMINYSDQIGQSHRPPAFRAH
jgi:hypothetical protein